MAELWNKIKKILSSVRAFYKQGTKPVRLAKYSATILLLLLILTAAAAEYTSRPSFCPTCHYMESFYQSWRTSAHNKVDCVECHFEPGISGTVRGKLNGLVQIVNYISLTYKKRKPWAEIPDNTCSRSGCHEIQAIQDTVYDFRGVGFSHKHHLQDLRRGKTLKCVSCHSQIVQGTHIEVTGATCFNCHFKRSDDPEHKFDKLSNCVTCHSWENKTKEEMARFRYDHTPVVERKMSCYSCHTNTVSGNGEVGKERCFQCHFENDRLNRYEDTETMHKIHITQHSVQCFNCHSPIEHKVQKIDPKAPPDCMTCHSDAHSQQVSLFTGEGGFETGSLPSSMFLNGINCRGCHVFHDMNERDITTFKAGGTSCEHCHGKGYDNLVVQWKTATVSRLSIINNILRIASGEVSRSGSGRKQEAEKYLDEARHNIRIVDVGKSVHNVLFSDKLLQAAYSLMQKALTVIGSPVNLPRFQSSAEFVPNECYNCHSGIQEISVTKFGMKFSHNLHIVTKRIACAKCHSNAKKHGELIITKDGCNSCHHVKVNTDDDCAKCHQFQNRVYSGDYMEKNQPDFMKSGGVHCIDCHSDGMRIIKPDVKICLKCHDNSYQEMGIEWESDIKKLLLEADGEVRGINSADLDAEGKTLVAEVKKIINDISSRPSIYVHNYDLLSSLLSEKIKQLKKLK